MTNINRKPSEARPENREVDGLFCEEVLRDWLENLEELVRQRDTANAEALMQERKEPKKINRLFTVVQDSGRGT